MLEYKVVESSMVTDEDLQSIINEHVSAGWAFDGIQFAMRESSKRPAMAFVLFTRSTPRDADEPGGASWRCAGARKSGRPDGGFGNSGGGISAGAGLGAHRRSTPTESQASTR